MKRNTLWNKVFASGLALLLCVSMLPQNMLPYVSAETIDGTGEESTGDTGSTENTETTGETTNPYLYFVDCGDADPNTCSEGVTLGTAQSVTDQVFGADATTGKKWGLYDEAGPRDYYTGAQAKTKWIGSKPDDGDDTLSKEKSFVFAESQYENNAPKDIYVSYKFEMDSLDGTYPVEIGLSNTWGNAKNPAVYGNYGSDDQTVLRTTEKDITGNTVVKGEVTAVDGYITIDFRITRAVTGTPGDENHPGDGANRTIQVTYLILGQEKPDLSELSALYGLVQNINNDANGEGVKPYDENLFATFDAARTKANTYLQIIDEFSLPTQAEVDTCYNTLKTAYDNLRNATDKVNNNYLYYVDCGDANTHTVSADAALGRANTLTDQVYATDPVTGKMWGLWDPAGGQTPQGDRVQTTYNGGHDLHWGSNDNLTVAETFTYAKGQSEAQIDTLYVTYKFEVDSPDGTYPITIGLSNSWGNATHPAVYGNYGQTEKQTTLEQDADVKQGNNKVIKGNVQAIDGFITVDVRMSMSPGSSLQVTYIAVGNNINPSINGYSLTLDGNIGVNFYAIVPEDVTLQITDANGVEQEYVEGEVDPTYGTSYTIKTAAKNMTDKYTVSLLNSTGNLISGQEQTVSVQDYAIGAMTKYPKDTELRDLLCSMLNYGSQAQIYFNTSEDKISSDKLANSVLTGDWEKAIKQYEQTNWEKHRSTYAETSNMEKEGVAFYGSSLILESETTMRQYFAITNTDYTSNNASNLKMYYKLVQENGKEITDGQVTSVSLARSGETKYYFADIPNIAAKGLGDRYEVWLVDTIGTDDTTDDVQITDGKIWGAYSYLYQLWTKGNAEETRDEKKVHLANSMMDYGTAAVTYFN